MEVPILVGSVPDRTGLVCVKSQRFRHVLDHFSRFLPARAARAVKCKSTTGGAAKNAKTEWDHMISGKTRGAVGSGGPGRRIRSDGHRAAVMVTNLPTRDLLLEPRRVQIPLQIAQNTRRRHQLVRDLKGK